MYQPIYHISPYLLNLIHESAELKALIEHNSVKLSWLPVLQSEARRRGAHSSTAIEGNPLSLSQVKSIDQGQSVKAPKVFEQEITNYLGALRWIEKNVDLPINEKNLLTIHKIIVADILPNDKAGGYKKKQNYVINEEGLRVYTPPSVKETPGLVRDLLNWLNSKEISKLHSIIVCAVVHHRLVSIHPFSDGNGRLARAVATWVLYKTGFDTHYIFSMDEFFAFDLKRYYQKLQQARELDDNLTPWIEYVAEGVVATLKNVKKRIQDLHLSALTDIELTPRQEELIRVLRDKPRLAVSGLQKELGLTRARINQILPPLLKNSIVVKEGKSRATRYKLAGSR